MTFHPQGAYDKAEEQKIHKKLKQQEEAAARQSFENGKKPGKSWTLIISRQGWRLKITWLS